jgi:tRNA dimethylallyltransferase
VEHEALREERGVVVERGALQEHNTTDLLDRQRLVRAIEIAEGEAAAEEHALPLPELRPLVFGLRWERAELRRRITVRLKERLDQGLIEEVAALHDAGVPWERLEFYGLEYRFVARHLKGEISCNDMFQQLNSAIHDFAKRQETWFRRMERQGTTIHWLAGAEEPLRELLEIIRLQKGPRQLSHRTDANDHPFS